MARYLQAKCRRCRAENQKLFLKGERCLSVKCPIDKSYDLKRKYAPGKSSGTRLKKKSVYGVQLKEKQKMKQIYGVLERQFRRYFEIANRQKGITGENLVKILECRLDNVLYRMHFASSRAQARQLVLHGHVQVNGKKVNIPSYSLKEGDTISIKDKSKGSTTIAESLKAVETQGVMPWLEVNAEALTGVLKQIPRRSEVVDLQDINEQLIVELYSK
jgi:small subunit ribosomal protein S4